MPRLALTCAFLALAGFAAGRFLLQPAEATGTDTPLQVTDAEAHPRPEADTTLYLRAGDADRITRTRDALTLTLVPGEAPERASTDPLADGANGLWHLRLAAPGQPDADLAVKAFAVTGVQLVQLDADARYEALVLTYTGGAHCCTTFHAFDVEGETWRRDSVAAGSFGFTLRDLDGDGAVELVGEDPRFEYAFSSFASSRGASRIVALRDGRLREVTREPHFRPILEAHRAALTDDLARTTDDLDARRGVLAALVAEYALLGDVAGGLALVSRHLPEAERDAFERDLRAFLAEHGFTPRR